MSNFTGYLDEANRRTARDLMRSLIQSLDEQLVPVTVAGEHPIFARLGLTDATIANLIDEGLTIITVDLDLWVHLARAGAAAVNFNHIRSGS